MAKLLNLSFPNHLNFRESWLFIIISNHVLLWTLSPLYLQFKKLKISRVEPIRLCGAWFCAFRLGPDLTRCVSILNGNFVRVYCIEVTHYKVLSKYSENRYNYMDVNLVVNYINLFVVWSIIYMFFFIFGIPQVW